MSERSNVAAPKQGGDVGVVRAIVAGHGDFASGLISAVEAITGRGDQFVPISGRGHSAASLEEVLRSAIERTRVRVVFTDLHAGSCTMAARRVLRDRQDVLFVAGANLPMLLDFAMSSEPEPMQAARHAIERGRAAISSVGGGDSGAGGQRA
ncbi:MAG: PTS sugar transporter subunit IIA [Gemmatimonadaceae bacterium]